jgi:hypothetical protein
MTLTILVAEETSLRELGPPKRDLVLRLTCDGTSLLCESTGYRSQSHIDNRHRATEDGWLFTRDGKQFGPCCRGGKR